MDGTIRRTNEAGIIVKRSGHDITVIVNRMDEQGGTFIVDPEAALLLIAGLASCLNAR